MADDVDESNDEPADARDKGRVRAGEDGESGSGTDSDPDHDDSFEQLWESLSPSQKKVAQEFVYTSTKADAARAVDLAPQTVYNWDDKVWEASEKLVDRRREGIEQQLESLSPLAIEAVRRALDPDTQVSREEREMAEFVLEQRLGKATQRQNVNVSAPGVDADSLDEARDAVSDVAADLFGSDDEDEGEE